MEKLIGALFLIAAIVEGILLFDLITNLGLEKGVIYRRRCFVPQCVAEWIFHYYRGIFAHLFLTWKEPFRYSSMNSVQCDPITERD